jgi:hypothetical protein
MKLSIIAMLLSSSLLASSHKSPSFDQMTLDERKKTGIEKLSQEERLFLEQWIKSPGKERPKGLRRAVFITEMAIAKFLEEGKFIAVENGDLFEVNSHYQKKIKEWKIGDKVRIYQSKKPVWFKFEHVQTHAIISVKKMVQELKSKDPQPANA